MTTYPRADPKTVQGKASPGETGRGQVFPEQLAGLGEARLCSPQLTRSLAGVLLKPKQERSFFTETRVTPEDVTWDAPVTRIQHRDPGAKGAGVKLIYSRAF